MVGLSDCNWTWTQNHLVLKRNTDGKHGTQPSSSRQSVVSGSMGPVARVARGCIAGALGPYVTFSEHATSTCRQQHLWRIQKRPETFSLDAAKNGVWPCLLKKAHTFKLGETGTATSSKIWSGERTLTSQICRNALKPPEADSIPNPLPSLLSPPAGSE